MSIGIVLKTINNEIYNYNVPNNLPVPELKQMVRQSTSIPEERQRLIYRGHVLQDGNALNDYKIEDGHTIHMVARPSDYEELRNQISRREETQQTTSSSSVRDSLQSLLALSSLIGDSNVSRPGADRNDPSPPEVSTSLEPIRQSLLTMHTLLSTMNPAQIESSTSQTTRKYFVGQWLDVKDTVNQWLEATIMQVDNEQGRIFVHYNGWPTRWDEWIGFTSPRLAPFRTRTSNTTVSTFCPAPTHAVVHAPRTGRDDVRILIPEMNRLVQSLQPLLETASLLCEEGTKISGTDTDENYAEGMPWDQNNDHGKTRGLQNNDEYSEERLKGLLTDICPLVDRLGRAFTDLSPHLQRYCQPASTEASAPPTRPQAIRQGLFPFGPLLSRQMRPPSPPPESFFRTPITNPPRSSNPSGPGNGSHVDIHIHAILTPVRMNGGQDPPNSRDELNPLENNSSTEAHESSSENISSLLAPLLSESMRSDPDHAPNEDGTFEESDFDSLKHDSEMISPQDCRSMSETYRSDSPHIFSEDVDFPGLKSMENESMLPRDDPSSLKKKKSKSKSPSKSESTDWRMVGRSRERSTSMRKKAEHSISPSDTSHLSMSTDQRSSSTRREMRGLMKAIDTASATASPHLDVNQEKKELKSSDKQQSVIKSPPRKSSSLESTSSRRSEIVDSPRRSTEEGVQEIHPVQSRQASAENSFIQRVRRSLSFRNPQQKQTPKQP